MNVARADCAPAVTVTRPPSVRPFHPAGTRQVHDAVPRARRRATSGARDDPDVARQSTLAGRTGLPASRRRSVAVTRPPARGCRGASVTPEIDSRATGGGEALGGGGGAGDGAGAGGGAGLGAGGGAGLGGGGGAGAGGLGGGGGLGEGGGALVIDGSKYQRTGVSRAMSGATSMCVAKSSCTNVATAKPNAAGASISLAFTWNDTVPLS